METTFCPAHQQNVVLHSPGAASGLIISASKAVRLWRSLGKLVGSTVPETKWPGHQVVYNPPLTGLVLSRLSALSTQQETRMMWML